MPTYKNNTALTIKLPGEGGGYLSPGEEIVTPFFFDHENLGLTELSEEPLWNRVVDSQILTALSATEQSVLVHKDARFVIVLGITGSVAMSRNAKAEKPELENHQSEDVVIPIKVDGIPGRTKRLVFTGSGNCRVVLYREY